MSTNIEPELARRLLKTLEHFGGRVVIDSGYRSRAQQQALYDAWVASGYTNPPSVAKPGTSKHERDPAEAADLHRNDPDLKWGEVHYTAAAYGLIFPIAREDWHAELDPAWVDPAPPAPPAPTEDPTMLRLIVTDDPAGAQLVYTGDTISWVRSGDALGILDRGQVRTVDCTVAEVQAMLLSVPHVGPSPSENGSAIAW